MQRSKVKKKLPQEICGSFARKWGLKLAILLENHRKNLLKR